MAHALQELYHEIDDLAQREGASAAVVALEARLDEVRASFGEGSAEYAAVLNDLGMFCRMDASYAAARKYFAQAAEVLCVAVGPTHPEYGTAVMNLAGIMRVEGDVEASLKLFEKALDVFAASLGTNSASYLTAMNNIALCYQDAGDVETALSFHVQACQALEALSEGNPERRVDYATSLYNTGLCFRQAGEDAVGSELITRSLDVYGQVLPADHPLALRAAALLR